MSGHKSRLKEKLAQARRLAFLLRADNKSALVGIIDSVRELASNNEERWEGGKSAQRNNGPSPLERDRFISWAADVEKLLVEFEPSENHANDPLLRVLEHFQFLQDGHVCLAEVAMDARALLERWDRAGAFDSESSSDDDDDDEGNDNFPADFIGFLAPNTPKDNIRHLEQSYAYQNIRQRAAASIIKRNVLTWVRSKASFCDRVAEIEVFGRTTEALLKELSLTSAALAGTSLNGSTDIFALATGRCDPKSRYNGTIAFKDLLQFSKHLALFPVDQALRTVEDVTRRRYLFDSRCAMKIQAVWRQVREAVRARRLRRVIEELRLKREQEAQAKRDAAKEAKKRKQSEAGKRKVSKPLKRSSTARSSVIASAIPRLISTATPGEEVRESPKELSPSKTREAVTDTNDKRKPLVSPVTSIDVSNRSRGDNDDRFKSPASTPRSRQRASRVRGASNSDSDDDTTDVEAAWKSFMDTVATDMALQEPSDDTFMPERPPSSPMPPVILPPMEDTWESWSDSEIDLGNNENQETDAYRPLSTAKPSAPSMPCAPTPRMKTISKNNNTNPVVRRREPLTSRRYQSRVPTAPNTSVARPLSSLPFDATLQNHTGPYTGAGQLSLMAPFIDANRSTKAQAVVVPERKHLYELDFTGAQRNDATIVHIATALVGSGDSQMQEQPQRSETPEKPAVSFTSAFDTPRASSRRATVARLRSITSENEQNSRIRELLGPKDRDFNGQQDTSASRGGNNSSKGGYIIYGAQGRNIQREVILRKGTMVYSPLTGPPEEESSNSVVLKTKEEKAWHRSTIAAIPQVLAAPHPPTDRFQSRHKRRPKGPQRKTISTETLGQIMAIETPTRNKSKQTGKNNELPLLLRRSRAAARRREAERVDVLPDDDGGEHSDIPVPDANKQMWKRGGELPELVLAHIRDRVGYKQNSSTQKRMSIIAGRAPPTSGLGEDTTSTAPANFNSLDDRPETIFPVDEELGEEEDESTSEDEPDDNLEQDSDNEDNPEVDGATDPQNNSNNANGLERGDSVGRCKKSDELNEEFHRLHLASRERELTGRRLLLTQLQSEEETSVNDFRRRSKDENLPSRKRVRRSRGDQAGEPTSVTNSDDVVSVLVHGSSEYDSDGPRRRRRQLRVKTRDPTTAPFESLSDESEDEEEERMGDEREITGMTQQERDAAFQKLLAQYLGLLQCSPARRLHVNYL